MTTGNQYAPARRHLKLTVGDSVRIARELNGLTQTELAKAAKLTQATVSAIEHNRSLLGVDRAKRLAAALRVHPAVLLFPDWEEPKRVVHRAPTRRVA